MIKNTKKLLENHAIPLSEAVTTARLERAGVTLGDDLGLRKVNSLKEVCRKHGFSVTHIKKLAGG